MTTNSNTFRSLAIVAILLLVSAPFAFGQNRTFFAGEYNALNFAFGVTANVAPLVIDQPTPTAAGSATLTVRYGYTTLGDGTVLFPLSTNASLIVGGPTNAETVTPTAVNCTTPQILDSCTITATFANPHGNSEPVTSATFGLQEAINYVNANGGGVVMMDRNWQKAGGTNAIITGATAFASVQLDDNRGGTSSTYWTMQPTTLTSLAAPATLTGTTATFNATPVGTWTNAAQYLCVTYVDSLGGEGPCSATYNTTPSANTSLTITSPAASTGAVGWRAYGGASYNGAYLLPIAAANCTLTTLESVIPACAIGSNGTWTAIFVNTTTLRPNAQSSPTVNLNLPYPQGHTTFGYQPVASLGSAVAFQTNYGPFVAFGSTTSGQQDIIGSVNLPTGFLNYIGRTIRISGKVALTANTAAIPTLSVELGWVGGTTAGAPVALCTNTGAAYGSSAAFGLTFECTMTVNATGSSAATIMTKGLMNYNVAAGGAAGVTTIDTGTAAIGSLGLSQQNTVYVAYTSGTNTTSAVQLLDLHVETLQ